MGWSDVLASVDVANGQIVEIESDSVEIVLWRTTSGELAACDARCPHQWAPLATAGVVDGDELVCLSHFWRFGTDGAGSKLAATGRRDEKAANRIFRVEEHGGRIMLWSDDAGDPSPG
jgi:phenylpropionate dioxygenase-like ring-hydroxylating dioxygenase large terminal subunit